MSNFSFVLLCSDTCLLVLELNSKRRPLHIRYVFCNAALSKNRSIHGNCSASYQDTDSLFDEHPLLLSEAVDEITHLSQI